MPNQADVYATGADASCGVEGVDMKEPMNDNLGLRMKRLELE
jgi:hypothetical protein